MLSNLSSKNIENKKLIHSQINLKNLSHKDSLVNINNQFLEEALIEEEELIPESEEDEEQSNKDLSKSSSYSQSNNINKKKPNKRGKYKIRNPLYYYYNIEGLTYKYTWKNKNRKNILDFRCTNTTCKAQALYYKNEDKFKVNVFSAHKSYEDHTYNFNEFYRKKFKENSFKEELKKIIGEYFKNLFYEDENLIPTIAKEKFHNKFPNININEKEIDNYIKVKHREMKKVHIEKIINTKSLFELQDREGNKISYVLDYQDKENPEKEYKMVLIANVNMYNNLKNNQITQFFMDCTYKMVPPNKKNILN